MSLFASIGSGLSAFSNWAGSGSGQALLGGLGSFGNSALSLAGAIHTNKTNEKIARRQRQLAIYFAKNSHQLEVDDLRAAGLNPILSAGGSGANGQVPSAIPAQNPFSGFDMGIGTALEIYQKAKALENETKVADAQAANLSTAAEANRESALGQKLDNAFKEATAIFRTGKTQADYNRARAIARKAVSDANEAERQFGFWKSNPTLWHATQNAKAYPKDKPFQTVVSSARQFFNFIDDLVNERVNDNDRRLLKAVPIDPSLRNKEYNVYNSGEKFGF